MLKRLLFLLSLVLLLSCNGSGENTAVSGQIITVLGQAHPDMQIARVDLANEQSTTLFQAPEFSQIFQISLDPAQENVYFSYSPPPSGGSGFFDRAGIYTLPTNAANGTPTPLLGGNTTGEYLLMPTFSPNGRFLFYVKQAQDPNSISGGFLVTLERYDLETGQNQTIVLDGIWPRISPDGEKLVFIGVEPQSLQRALVLTDLDGSSFEILVGIGRFFDIDAPIFSPDGQHIYFSVAEEAPVSLMERLLGVQIAHAHADHNVPSDWWRIPTTGGEPEQITFFKDIILHGDFKSETNQLIFSTQTGLFTLEPDQTVVPIRESTRFNTVQVIK
ncbi:MAG: hypothetical protein AAF490_00310 [Chloroflexota bacterium]